MSLYAFPLYATLHFLIFIWCVRFATAHKAPGAWLVAMIAGGLVYDNSIIALGASIGVGPVLEALSWPRFFMHAVLTPFMMIAVTQMAVAGGVRWAATRAWRIAVWILVIGGIAEGSFAHLIGLQLEPSCFDGILRYTGNVPASQLCFAGQEPGAGGGPPIPSIVGNLITLIVGVSLWRSQGWIWLMAGALVMFGAAAMPISGYGLMPGNGGEVVLLLSYAATTARFSKRKVFSSSEA